MTIATPEYIPPRPIASLCIGTPSTLAPPSFGRAISQLIFHLRAHGIECREAKPGLTLLDAYVGHPHKRPDAVLWIDGQVEFRVEDALALVDGIRHGIDVAGLLVPEASESIDWARIRLAVKRRATLDELAGAGLTYRVKLTEGEQMGRQLPSGRKFREVKELGWGCVIMHASVLEIADIRDYVEIFLTSYGNHTAYVLESAPTARRLPQGPPLLCKEPEWMLAELERRQKILVEGDWRREARARGVAITTVAFDEKVADIFAPVATMLKEGLWEIGIKATLMPKNMICNACFEHAERPPIHIILGAHIAAPDVDIPEGSIFFCAEQPAKDWVRFIKAEAELYRPSVIWSWADATTRMLVAAGLPAVTLPLGFVEGLVPKPFQDPSEPELLVDKPKDIDCLFFGGPTERRREILAAIAAKGINLHYERNCWGKKRDELISRSKVILNMRGNDFGPHGGVFEAVRALPLLARGCAVVSEKGEGWERYAAGCKFVDSPSEIPDAIEEVVGDYGLRHSLELDAVTAARAWPQAEFLRQLFNLEEE